MGNPDKHKGSEPTPNSQSQLEELRRAEKDVERRLAALESSVVEMRKSNLEGHKWFTTVMFTLVAVLLTILGIVSKSDVRDAIRDMKDDTRQSTAEMEAKVVTATTEMDKNFQSLAGESLKKPLLQISDSKGNLLDGQLFEIPSGSQLPIYPLFLKNIGSKKTEPLSIRLQSSNIWPDIDPEYSDWQQVPANSRDYPYSYYHQFRGGLMDGVTISPQETWTLTAGANTPSYRFIGTNIVTCLLQVFYGAESPAEAKFTIKMK